MTCIYVHSAKQVMLLGTQDSAAWKIKCLLEEIS